MPAQLALGLTVCWCQLTCPIKGSQLDWGLRCKKKRASETKRNLPKALSNGEKNSELKGFTGTLPGFGPQMLSEDCFRSCCCHQIWQKTKFRDAWVAQWLTACLWPRAWSWGPRTESHIGLPAWSLLLPLPVSLPLPPSLCVSHE